jgi:hypothetical protein
MSKMRSISLKMAASSKYSGLRQSIGCAGRRFEAAFAGGHVRRATGPFSVGLFRRGTARHGNNAQQDCRDGIRRTSAARRARRRAVQRKTSRSAGRAPSGSGWRASARPSRASRTIGDLVEAFLARALRHARVHVGVFVRLARPPALAPAHSTRRPTLLPGPKTLHAPIHGLASHVDPPIVPTQTTTAQP